jgi:hypothetical protein
MTLSDAERLAQYIRSLPDFVVYDSIGGKHNHIGATLTGRRKGSIIRKGS